MDRLGIRFLPVGILTLIRDSVASTTIAQMCAENIIVIMIQLCSPNGYHLCEERMLRVYIAEEVLVPRMPDVRFF